MFVKETLLQLKSYINPHTVIVTDFNTPHSTIDRLFRQKLNQEILELTDTIIQMKLSDKIIGLRKSNGMSQEDLAEKLTKMD